MRRSGKQPKFANAQVAAVFRTYPMAIRKKLLLLRQLILDTASVTSGVGKLEETLKWGQPSYLTAESKSGSTIRIDQRKTHTRQYAIYFHCQTILVETFREIFRDRLKFEGNRGIVFDENDRIPVAELRHCIALALTYHLNKKAGNRTWPSDRTGAGRSTASRR